MKAIMVMYDSLNRHMLSPYGCDWVHTPNFQRLAGRAVTFDSAFAGSMPCMPARRELHTGRYNFLHRSWGPIEPFDDSMPEILKNNGVYTHLVSDHYHYWEDGGCTYHNRYSSWEVSRGQEGDKWKSYLKIADDYPHDAIRMYPEEWANRKHMQREEDTAQARTFRMGLEFMEENKDQDNWFLTIETFDPHEPFFVPKKYQDMYPHDYDGPFFDWPPYRGVEETPEQVKHVRLLDAALHTMCDEYLGKVLDAMDRWGLWDDTMLIVNADHGFLLGEHDLWAKCHCPFYNEIAHMPLFIWDPRCGRTGERRKSLVQTIDLAPTLLEYFGAERTRDMQGIALRHTIVQDTPVREAGLFGIHGGHVNVTDGRYVYMRAPRPGRNGPLYQYTQMPTHMRNFFSHEELASIELAQPFSFTKGLKTMRMDVSRKKHDYRTLLFDINADHAQEHPLRDQAIEERMIGHLVRCMKDNDAPPEQFERLGL
jgi:arylsulfatase A-like enzyme